MTYFSLQNHLTAFYNRGTDY